MMTASDVSEPRPPPPSSPPTSAKDTVARVLLPVLALACLWPQVSTSVGLVAGVVVAMTVGNPWAKRTKPATTKLLQVAVVGLGFGMNLETVITVGAHGIVYTVVGIAAVMLAGFGLRMALGVRRDVGLLITVGTAICGGSAIAAVVPTIDAAEEDTTVSLAVVFILNAVGLLIFPPLGHAFGLDEARFGLWAALAIHDTSSVVGAASAYGPKALEIATTIKLTRALWIVPMALVIGVWASRAAAAAGVTTGPRSRPKPPWFILGFLAAAALSTFIPGASEVGAVIARGARQVLVLTLFLIGANLSPQMLQRVGVRPLILGVVLWIVTAGATLGAILAGIIA